MPRPAEGEYGSFYQTYIDKVPDNDALQVLANSFSGLKNFLATIPAEKAGFAYAAGKWTVKQLLQHVIDAERVFAYRAMCFARGEQQSLPGFDENVFAENAAAENRSLAGLAEELLLVRQTTILLYTHFTADALLKTGTANKYPLSVNSLAFIIVGHQMHHQQVLQERYFSTP